MSVVTQKPARSGRIPELILLVLAYLTCLISWILTHQGVHDSAAVQPLPPGFIPIAVFSALLIFGAHLLLRRWAPWADPVFFPAAVLLTGLGLVMIHRVDFALIARGGSPHVLTQAILAVVGITLMVLTVAFLRDHRNLRRITYISLIAGVILLLLPMTPGLGRTIYGSRLWINIFGFSYQPAELAKIFFTIFFAGYLVTQRDNLSLAGKKVFGIQLPRLRHFAPILLAWASCMGILMLERDFGTALLFFGLFVAMLYVATERVSWLLIGGILTAAGVYVIVQLHPHIQARFHIWLHALDDAVYSAEYGSYQLVQGWFGMASGGMLGTGLGNGYPANAPAANSDFIIAAFGEEIGLVGLLAILVIYLLLAARALKTGIDLRDGFGKLLAAGLGFVIALQCFVVVGGVTRVIPLTGLAMPFLALGGSALLTNWIIVGILIRMSDAARRPYQHAAPLSEIETGDLPEGLLVTSGELKPTAAAEDAETTVIRGAAE